MGKVMKYTRRAFLVGAVAVAGGVAFGYYQVRKPHANPLLDDVSDGEAVFNPWVKIDGDGITLITPHVDLGQGAVSMQAALIAEELDVDFGQFNTDYGKPSAAYYNQAVTQEMAPFMSTDEKFQAEAMRTVLGTVAKLMGMQVTGGSSTVPDSYEKLRRAGAVARETLKLAASKKSGVPVSQLKTEKGSVILPDGTALAYTQLAADAAGLEPVNDVTLRDPQDWRMLGKSMDRIDIVAKSTGTQVYGIDLEIPGMVHATVITNPYKGGSVNTYDASEAEKMRGVKKVVPVTGGIAVIADNTWRAIQAARMVEIDWADGAYPPEMAGHWKILEDSFTEDRLDSKWRDDGDVDANLGDQPIQAEYRVPYVAHAPLEPLCAIVKVDETSAEVWASTQMPRFVQNNVARITGLEPDQVTINNQYSGGSFGHRGEDENIKRTTEVAMSLKGTPVKLTYSREEDFAQDYPRQISMARMQGAVKDGKVETIDISVSAPSTTTSQMGRQFLDRPGMADGQIAAGAWNMPMAIPNFRMTAYQAPHNELAPTSAWRSVGASSNGFFAESFLDELIAEAGADPLEERLRLVNDDIARKVLEAVGDMSGWGGDLGAKRGRGLALVNSFGVPVAEVVEVTDTENGIRIDKVFVAADVGRVLDPIAFDNQVKGGVIWGLGHAMNCEITYSEGRAQQENYWDHEGMRFNQCPEIEVRGLENSEKIRGIGEPPVPPAAPALANAIFAATGTRLREMPFNKTVTFA
ncbi:xanthine dehydrogenase family protein molybdopterin-binding subunit [Roseibium sp. MMSF_3544]|uniref:xanthine dehydrogenase family protein molybdopterin-binding subunit n=1 Tax=unclassified Roseibium TaxID=2629323 RepID=UPI00273E9329|nr:molybdopterin cofactor-binding domain-containing protein [Roseibium sp. MMSF_3544]